MTPFPEKERYTYEDLLEIIRLLRAPEGCPWDRAQTHLLDLLGPPQGRQGLGHRLHPWASVRSWGMC